jgi:UDP-3-O-[3-hydroxymyristoyl] N-acetylglucosamine deacetylase
MMNVLQNPVYISEQNFQKSITLQSVGLISGLTVKATLRLGKTGSGVVFYWQDGTSLPACSTTICDAQRGVTLLEPKTKRTLSIVEHFLAAVALAGHPDLELWLDAEAGDRFPCELPLLDGSALLWFNAIVETFGFQRQAVTHRVVRPSFFSVSESITLYALPSDTLKLGYVLNYPHQDLRHQWAYWNFDSRCEAEARELLQARTFGEVKELPYLQAKGLAKGVSLENTLGLTEDGKSYTSALRLKNEPLYHKMLDLLGDFYLSGIPLASVQGTFVALYGGHASHLAFAQHLKEQGVIEPIQTD